MRHLVDQATHVSSPPRSLPSSMHPSRSQQFALQPINYSSWPLKSFVYSDERNDKFRRYLNAAERPRTCSPK